MILTQYTPGKIYSRIVSLVPSQTELLYCLGLEKEVAGITKFCVHPDKWFRNKTRTGGTKKINLQTIQQLSPDLIIANKEENVKEQVEKLSEFYDVWITDVNNLNDALQMIKDIGTMTGKLQPALQLVSQIRSGFDRLSNNLHTKKRAAYFIWKDPWMVAGSDTFINDMMSHCGFENIFSDTKRYPSISLGELKEKNPEWILLSSEPYPFKEKHKEEIQEQLPGVKILLVDGEMFSWYGSRLLQSAEYFLTFSDSAKG